MRVFAIPVAWILGALAAFLSGFGLDPYLESVRGLPQPHPYPTNTLLWVLLLMSAQALITGTILRPASSSLSLGRSFFALILALGFLALGIGGGMHAPNPWHMYLLWLLVTAFVLFALVIWAVIGAVFRPGT